MEINNLVSKITRDVAVELSEEYDLNFERKGFFDKKWPDAKYQNRKGTLMMRSGNLRRSITYNVRENMIMWSSSLAYASIHNEGGEITVTPKMKKFFWAMYYKATGGMKLKKDGTAGKSKQNDRLSQEAGQWKALALMPVGHKIKIQKRQFIGDHPKVREAIDRAVTINLPEIDSYIRKSLKK